MLRRAPLLSTVLLAALACEPPRSTPPDDGDATTPAAICAHARDRSAALGRFELDELDAALGDQDVSSELKAASMDAVREVNAGIDANFVPVCVELDEAELACMAEVDSYIDAILAARRGRLDCEIETGDPSACQATWLAKVRAAEAHACHLQIQGTRDAAYRRYREELMAARLAADTAIPQDDHDSFAGPNGGTFLHSDGPLPEAEVDEAHGVGGLSPGDRDSGPKVRQAEATIEGALDRDIIRRIVRAHLAEVRHCYDQGLVNDPDLGGEIIIEFVIGPTGSVVDSEAEDPDAFADPEVPRCVAMAVKTWKFPKPQGGGEVEVRYPFNLEPG